ncbi:MAG: M56 family metallopeptidase, partial [Myxococcales bacterium FL481]
MMIVPLALYATTASGWLLTFLAHSTLFVAVALVLGSRWVKLPLAWQHRVWRATLIGPLITTAALLTLPTPWAKTVWPLVPAVVPGVGEPADPPPTGDRSPLRRTPPARSTQPGQAEPDRVLAYWAQPDQPGSVQQPALARPQLASPLARPVDRGPQIGPISGPVTSAAVAHDRAPIALHALVAAVLTALISGAVGLLLAMRQIRRAHRVLARRTPIHAGPGRELLDELCRSADRQRMIALSECDPLTSPVALLGHEICLPRGFASRVCASSLRAALAHEMAHVVRGDAWWLHIAALVQAAFPFQPLFRIARRRLQDSAEFLSDDQAVHLTQDGVGLAKCLAEVANMKHTTPCSQPLLPAMASRHKPLLARVQRLVDERSRPRERDRRTTLAILAAAVGVFIAAAPVVVDAEARSAATAPPPLGSDASASAVEEGARAQPPADPSDRRSRREVRRDRRRQQRAERRAERAGRGSRPVDRTVERHHAVSPGLPDREATPRVATNAATGAAAPPSRPTDAPTPQLPSVGIATPVTPDVDAPAVAPVPPVPPAVPVPPVTTVPPAVPVPPGAP